MLSCYRATLFTLHLTTVAGWNQKIDARRTNYGTRIDYFLLTKGLLPWFKHGDIQPQVKGSDHCPVYIDLHDQITDNDGRSLYLKDTMKMNGKNRDPPRLATRYWPEYSGKQKLLSTFFEKKAVDVTRPAGLKATFVSVTVAPETTSSTIPSSPVSVVPPQTPEAGAEPHPSAESQGEEENSQHTTTSPELVRSSPRSSSFPSNLTASSSSNPTRTDHSSSTISPPLEILAPLKRKKMQADSNYPAQALKKPKKSGSTSRVKSKNPAAAQTKLSSFFAGPTSSQSQSNASEDERKTPSESQEKSEIIDVDALLHDSDDVSSWPGQSCPPTLISSSSQPGKGKGKNNSHSWSTLFARIEPPKCIVHGEPAREFTVNKPGPNKGKAFFICARCVCPVLDQCDFS